MDRPTFSTIRWEKVYVVPFCRIVFLDFEYGFLQSNLEPIDGGDDPDIDW